jgi:hypothetical protein
MTEPILCKKCGEEIVFISYATLKEIINTLHPTLKSPDCFQLTKGKDVYQICPACDAYALGQELTEGFPFTDQRGEVLTVQQWFDRK